MELYVYRYSKPSRKRERERERTTPCARPRPESCRHPRAPDSWDFVSYSIVGGKRCLLEINTLWKNVDAGAGGKTCDAG